MALAFTEHKMNTNMIVHYVIFTPRTHLEGSVKPLTGSLHIQLCETSVNKTIFWLFWRALQSFRVWTDEFIADSMQPGCFQCFNSLCMGLKKSKPRRFEGYDGLTSDEVSKTFQTAVTEYNSIHGDSVTCIDKFAPGTCVTGSKDKVSITMKFSRVGELLYLKVIGIRGRPAWGEGRGWWYTKNYPI